VPTRLCSAPRCPEPATYRGRCQAHAADNERQVNRAGHAIYRTKRWQLLRRKVLREQPLCPDPCGDIATDVDHIKSIEDGGDPWARANLQGLCHSHHAAKTRAEQQARARA
jgi:5-methylcytosine-specific restriction endonuclease McrA